MVWSKKLPDQKSLVRRMVKYPLSENNDTFQGPLHAQGYSSAAGTIWQPGILEMTCCMKMRYHFLHAVGVKLPIACSLSCDEL